MYILLYLNKSLCYSNELYSLFPPLGFISNSFVILLFQLIYYNCIFS